MSAVAYSVDVPLFKLIAANAALAAWVAFLAYCELIYKRKWNIIRGSCPEPGCPGALDPATRRCLFCGYPANDEYENRKKGWL